MRLKEALAPQEVNIKQKSNWFFNHCLKSAFMSEEQKIEAFENILEEAIIKSKAVERKRIERFIYKHPEAVQRNKELWDIRYGVINAGSGDQESLGGQTSDSGNADDIGNGA